MGNILKNDLYRFLKSKLFYGFAVLSAIIAFSLMMLNRLDIRIGISVLGDLTAFKGTDDIIRVGIQYQKGLGLFVAIMLSVFIGQEYHWGTWQNKYIANKNRANIYLSKVVFSSIGSAVIFLVYQTTALLSSSSIHDMFTSEYIARIICGLFVYVALGTVICLFSMLIKNNISSTIICLCYILFSETFTSMIKNISGFSDTAARLVDLCVKHSVYGMSILVSDTAFSSEFMISIIVNSLVIILLSTLFGLIIFNKYEL